MSMTIDKLKEDLKSIPGSWRVLCWTGFDQTPFSDGQFREYLVHADELLAALTGQPAPPPTTIRVKVNSANGLRVRSAPVTGAILTVLPNNTIIEVFEVQETAGWYKLSSGEYAGGYVSAQYTEKV